MIYLLGGGGYIGGHLEYALDRKGFKTSVVDLDIYNLGRRAKRNLHGRAFKGTVVYLASFHREPPNLKNLERWEAAYNHLMVDEPLRIAKGCKKFIYLSSTRAMDGDNSLYAATKQKAEAALKHLPNTWVVRPGTVWGACIAGTAARPNTAVNFAITRGEFEGDHWRHYTLHLPTLLKFLMEILTTDMVRPGVWSITDSGPLVADDLRELLAGTHRDKELQALFTWERQTFRRQKDFNLYQDRDAALRLEAMYNLERHPEPSAEGPTP